MYETETICYVMAFQSMPTQHRVQRYNSHTGLNNIHPDVISSLTQHSVLLSYPLGVEFQRTSGCSALLLFPSTALDRRTHTTWLNSHKLSLFLSLTLPLSLHCEEETGGDWTSGTVINPLHFYY